MHQTYLKHLSQHFNLGVTKQAPVRIHGGLLHIMWRLDTDTGSYAIKQLSKDINLNHEQIIHNYELSERIASRFVAQSIPGVSAIAQFGKHLFIIDGTVMWAPLIAAAQQSHHYLDNLAIMPKCNRTDRTIDL